MNSKERFHPNINGNALDLESGKISFLRQMADWMQEWFDSGRPGLSKQTASAFIQTNRAILDLCEELLHGDEFTYILTGRLQTDPLERGYSQYRQMSGGRFLVGLKDVLRSENIIEIRTCLKRNIDLEHVQNSDQVPADPIFQTFLEDMADIPPVVLDSDAYEVAVYVAGYVLHTISSKTPIVDCEL